LICTIAYVGLGLHVLCYLQLIAWGENNSQLSKVFSKHFCNSSVVFTDLCRPAFISSIHSSVSHLR